MIFLKISYLQKRTFLNSIGRVCVKKVKIINILDAKLAKSSDTTKLANFNTGESNILTDK